MRCVPTIAKHILLSSKSEYVHKNAKSHLNTVSESFLAGCFNGIKTIDDTACECKTSSSESELFEQARWLLGMPDEDISSSSFSNSFSNSS